MPMISGGTPATPMPLMMTIGLRPRLLASLADMTTVQAAPSLRPEALPAVTVPPSLKTAGSLAMASRVLRRGCSSVSKGTISFFTFTGTGMISSLKRPDSIAAKARVWLSRPKTSCSSRLMLYFSARFSAVQTHGQVCRRPQTVANGAGSRCWSRPAPRCPRRSRSGRPAGSTGPCSCSPRHRPRRSRPRRP